MILTKINKNSLDESLLWQLFTLRRQSLKTFPAKPGAQKSLDRYPTYDHGLQEDSKKTMFAPTIVSSGVSSAPQNFLLPPRSQLPPKQESIQVPPTFD